MNGELIVERFMEVYISSRRCSHGIITDFIAWMTFEYPLTDSAVTEPSDPVYFEFGNTREEAIGKLKLDYPKMISVASATENVKP